MSVTKNLEIKSNVPWWDGKGAMTLIDCPGLSDAEGGDQRILDEMHEQLKEKGKVRCVDAFVMMMAGDRLKNAALMENMKCYAELLGGEEMVW